MTAVAIENYYSPSWIQLGKGLIFITWAESHKSSLRLCFYFCATWKGKDNYSIVPLESVWHPSSFLSFFRKQNQKKSFDYRLFNSGLFVNMCWILPLYLWNFQCKYLLSGMIFGYHRNDVFVFMLLVICVISYTFPT